MLSPFPGVDPFLEDQEYWREFHMQFISHAHDALAEQVPDIYEVRLRERLSLIDLANLDPDRDIRPDTEERSELRIEIRRFPARELVTAVELLSPGDKEPPGEWLYSKKRRELIHRRVHLIELDCLLGGSRLAMKVELPKGHYYAFVSRAARRPLSDVYAWSIRDPLPTIPIPLMAPDPDVPLDLSTIFNTAYQGARYERSIDYKAPLSLPLSTDDRAWAEALARGFDPRGAR